MNTREIRHLRRKFIVISMLSIFLVMLFIGFTVNVGSYLISRVSVDDTLDRLIDGEKVEQNSQSRAFSFSEIISPNYGGNTFFILRFDSDGKLRKLISNSAKSDETALVKEYAPLLLEKSAKSGQYAGYYYKRAVLENNQIVLAFLDGSVIIYNALRTMLLTILLGLFGLIVMFFLVRRLSARAIRPEIENSARQKRFITNASHELKTPLAVIRANTEMLELTGGENEWTASTLKQVDHLNGMIQNLVMITRSQEQEDRTELTEIDASVCVAESLDPYEPLAAGRGVTIERAIKSPVQIKADESKIRQLTTLLIDNAIKYCDENGRVHVALDTLKNGKGMLLTVSNDYADGAGVDCSHFFDRFYREDKSHNIDRGGYGIGLSIAESICKQYRGTISANWKNGVIRFVCALK